MGACQSRTRAADILSHASKHVHSSKGSGANTRKSQKLKLEIQKYDATIPSVLSPSGTRETIAVTPSSSLASPRLHADTVDTSNREGEQEHYASKKKLLTVDPVVNENNEIECHIGSDHVKYETHCTPAVSPSVVEQFQKLKLQVQQADQSTQRRKRREKNESRKETVNAYKHLWHEYEEIRNKVDSQDCREGIPESISFLKDSDAWYIDFHTIHHQQQASGKAYDPSSPSAANLSLLSQASIEAQKEFFKKKSNERKNRRKRKVLPHQKASVTKDRSASPTSRGMGSVKPSAQSFKRRMNTDSVLGNDDSNDYNVPYRNRSSSTPTHHEESYLHQTLSHPGTAEVTVPSSITLSKNFPRKRNEDLQSIRNLEFALSENRRNATTPNHEAAKKHSSYSVNPFLEMSKEQFLMMSSPNSGLTDETSTVSGRSHAVKRFKEAPRRFTDTPNWNLSNDQLTMRPSQKPSSQLATKCANYPTGKSNAEKAGEKSHSALKDNSLLLIPTIDFMSKADFLRMAALPEPVRVPIAALRDHVPMTVGHQTFDDSQVMSKISCEDTFMSPSGIQETVEEAEDAVHENSTSSDDDEEEDCYAWDGHMNDEDFWDMDIRRQSLDHIDELASQVSSQISTLLTKFREDNNSIKTRSVKL